MTPDIGILARSCISESAGIPLREDESSKLIRSILAEIRASGNCSVRIHDDPASHAAARVLGVDAFCLDSDIYLGSSAGAAQGRDRVIAHELVHVLQARIARSGGTVSRIADVEQEADAVAQGFLSPGRVRCGADPHQLYALWWLVPLGAAAYALLRPNNANAPTLQTRELQPSVSSGQIAGEAFALFMVPGGAMKLAAGLRLGFLPTGALVGGSTTVSLRAVEDLSYGEFSGGQVYVFDAALGSVVGMVIPGGVRLIGRAGTQSLDWLATQGLSRAEIRFASTLHQRAAVKPLAMAEVDAILTRAQGWIQRSSMWWVNRRGEIILYRGQREMTSRILSPMAREKGLAASRAIEERLRAAGVTSEEIALLTAQCHNAPVPPCWAPPGMAWELHGSAGIPTTRLPGVAAGFGGDSVVYVIRLPKTAAIKVPKWGLSVENEWIVLHEIPQDAIVRVIPASRIPPLMADDFGQLVPGR